MPKLRPRPPREKNPGTRFSHRRRKKSNVFQGPTRDCRPFLTARKGHFVCIFQTVSGGLEKEIRFPEILLIPLVTLEFVHCNCFGDYMAGDTFGYPSYLDCEDRFLVDLCGLILYPKRLRSSCPRTWRECAGLASLRRVSLRCGKRCVQRSSMCSFSTLACGILCMGNCHVMAHVPLSARRPGAF